LRSVVREHLYLYGYLCSEFLVPELRLGLCSTNPIPV
jgi:hypothetical protein